MPDGRFDPWENRPRGNPPPDPNRPGQVTAPGWSQFHQDYLLPGGRGWAPGAGDAYNQMGGLNEMGLPTIPGTIPWTASAMNWQDMHNQAVWAYRQRLMRGATDYLTGSLGNLQSFRPGGAAAMESGVYGQLAGNLMQRAQLTEPLDLLSSWREQKDFEARRRGRRSAQLSAAANVIGTLGAAAITAATGGAAAPFMIGGMGALAGTQAQRESSALGEATLGQGQLDIQPGQEGATGYGVSGPQPAGPSIPQGSDMGGGQTMLGPGIGNTGGPNYGGATGAPGSLGSPPSGVGQQGRQAAPGGQGGGPQMPGAGMQARIGMGGDFSPLSQAAISAARPGPGNLLAGMQLQESMVEMLEQDPGFDMIDASIQRQALLRLGA